MESRNENMRQKVAAVLLQYISLKRWYISIRFAAVYHQYAFSYYALPTLASITVPVEV